MKMFKILLKAYYDWAYKNMSGSSIEGTKYLRFVLLSIIALPDYLNFI